MCLYWISFYWLLLLFFLSMSDPIYIHIYVFLFCFSSTFCLKTIYCRLYFVETLSCLIFFFFSLLTFVYMDLNSRISPSSCVVIMTLSNFFFFLSVVPWSLLCASFLCTVVSHLKSIRPGDGAASGLRNPFKVEQIMFFYLNFTSQCSQALLIWQEGWRFVLIPTWWNNNSSRVNTSIFAYFPPPNALKSHLWTV